MSAATESCNLSEAEAWSLRFAPLRPRVTAFLRTFGLSAEDAQDLAQDSLLGAWMARDAYRGEGPIHAWLLAIARNRAITFLRSRSRRPLSIEDVDEMAIAFSSPVPSEGNLWVRAAALLSPREYRVLFLRYAEDLPCEAIAEVLELSPVNVRVILHRARRCLYQELDPREDRP